MTTACDVREHRSTASPSKDRPLRVEFLPSLFDHQQAGAQDGQELRPVAQHPARVTWSARARKGRDGKDGDVSMWSRA